MTSHGQKTILLVEDDIIVATTEAQTLKRFGYDVVTAPTAEKSVQLAAADRTIDLILMDIDLGRGMDGTEAARQILTMRTLPIVFLTSHAEQETVDRVRGVTRYGYVIKDSGDFVLQSSIEMAFELFEAHQTTKEKERILEQAQTLAHIGSWTWDIKNDQLVWSDEMYRIFGIEKKTFTGSLAAVIARAIHPEDRGKVEQSNMSVVKDKKAVPLEYRVIWPDKSVRTVWAEGGELILDADGNPAFFSGFVQDITDRKKSEDTIRASEEKLKTIFDTMSEGIALNEIIYDGDGQMVDYRIIEVNKVFYKIADYETDQVIGNVATKLYGMSTELIREFWKTHKDKKEIVYTEMYSPINNRCYYISTSPFENQRFVTSFFDITDRKHAEEALRRNERTLHTLLDGIPESAILINPDGTILAANETANHRLNLGEKDLAGKNIYQLLPPGAVRLHSKQIEAVLKTRRSARFVDEQFGQDIDNCFAPILNADGKVAQIALLGFDITERLWAEESLEESESNFKGYVENAPEGIFVADADGKFVLVNEEACRLTGYDRVELLEMTVGQLIYEDDRQRSLGRFRSLIVTKDYSGEGRFVTKNGEIRYLSIKAARLSDIRFLGFVSDITDRKRLEAAKQASEERFRQIYDKSPIAIELYDHDGVLIDVNRACCVLFGVPSAEAVKGFRLFDDPNIPAHQKELLKKGESIRYESDFDFDLVKQLGLYETTCCGKVVLDILITPIRRSDLDSFEYLVQIIDITRRRRLEEALRENEIRYRTLFDTAMDGIIIIDMEGQIVDVNDTFARMHGYTLEEMKTKNLRDISTDENAATIDKRIQHVATGEPLHFEVMHQHKKGHAFSLDAVANGIELGGRKFIVSFHRDLSERKKSEDQMRQLLTQRETLLKELQHRVKNNLNVVWNLLGLGMEKINDARAWQIFTDARTRIHSMLTIYEQLYHSADFSSIELDVYIQKLAKSLLQTYKVAPNRIKLKMQLASVPLDVNRAVPFGLIMNELMSNSLKYAYPSNRKGEIRIGLTLENGRIAFHMSDDGVGFPPEFDLEISDSMGLNIVKMLTKQIDGVLTMDGTKGVSVTIQMDL